MSHQRKVYYTRKRQRDEENGHQLKQQKTDASNTIEMESITFQTKLTDVNNDCLEKIFMHLSLVDLLNIAHTNKALKTAAEMAFARKFGKKQFFFSVSSNHLGQFASIRDSLVFIANLRTSLRLLRCYGHLISDLVVKFNEPFRTASSKVLNYANQYGFKTLKNILLANFSEDMIDPCMENVFKKIETVKMENCVLGKTTSKFNTWFPAVRCLFLHSSHLTIRSPIIAHFPHLEELALSRAYNECYFSPRNMTALFELNPQIRRITFELVEFEVPTNICRCSNASLFLRYIPIYQIFSLTKHSILSW